MDENLTPIIVAVIGVFQVILAIYFGRRNNEALATKDETAATVNIGESYSTLVLRLEERLSKLEEDYDELCEKYDESKKACEDERKELMENIIRLEILVEDLTALVNGD